MLAAGFLPSRASSTATKHVVQPMPGHAAQDVGHFAVAAGPAQQALVSDATHVESPGDWTAQGQAVPPIKVLIADGDSDQALQLARRVATAGHQTQIANDGFATLELAQAFRPHLVLVRANVTGLTTQEVCRRIRGTWWGAAVTVVAVIDAGASPLAMRKRDFDRQLEVPISQGELDSLLTGLCAS